MWIYTLYLSNALNESSKSSTGFILLLVCLVFLFLKMSPQPDVDSVVFLLSILVLVQFDGEAFNHEVFGCLKGLVGS